MYFPGNFLFPGKKVAPNYIREISLGAETAQTVYVSAIKMRAGN